MSENESQEVLLLAIEYLKTQFNSQQNPCVALYIARYYRLLGSLKNISHYEQKKYVDHSTVWLTRHVHKPEHIFDIQMEIHNPEYVSELNVFVR
jgi:hypothetical protein